jgi:type II secretory pathway pseudopilin PulG
MVNLVVMGMALILVTKVRAINHKSNGYSYLGVLLIVATIGLTLAMASTLWTFAQQREKERELIFIGNQFRRAIGQYYERTPGTVKTYPLRIEDLLQDSRYVTTQRYLRKIYIDPMTNQSEWGVINAPQGGIMGVFSKSVAKPIKQSGFQVVNNNLENQQSYHDWQFFYAPLPIPQNK